MALAALALLFVAHFTVPTARRGQTWGKRLAGLTVEKAAGGRLGWGRALLRAVADYLLIGLWQFVIGLADPIWIAFHGRKRALHDLIAGSQVRVSGAPSRLLPWTAALGWLAPVVLLLGVVRPFVVQAFYIPSAAMEPTLLGHDRGTVDFAHPGREHVDTVHDRILVNKLFYHLRAPARGDIVIFRAPPEAMAVPRSDVNYLKRIVGMPGERVEIRAHKGVLINGRLLREPYIPAERQADYDYGPITVPSGCYFVLGDNRRDSNDSHRWGPLDGRRLVGKMSTRLWPARR